MEHRSTLWCNLVPLFGGWEAVINLYWCSLFRKTQLTRIFDMDITLAGERAASSNWLHSLQVRPQKRGGAWTPPLSNN